MHRLSIKKKRLFYTSQITYIISLPNQQKLSKSHNLRRSYNLMENAIKGKQLYFQQRDIILKDQ